jgi:hypothetical protein
LILKLTPTWRLTAIEILVVIAIDDILIALPLVAAHARMVERQESHPRRPWTSSIPPLQP